MPVSPLPPVPSRPTDHKFLQDGMSAMSASATTVTGWSLTILGATVAGIVAGHFLRPSAIARGIYLLFIPGWAFLGVSIWSTAIKKLEDLQLLGSRKIMKRFGRLQSQ